MEKKKSTSLKSMLDQETLEPAHQLREQGNIPSFPLTVCPVYNNLQITHTWGKQFLKVLLSQHYSEFTFLFLYASSYTCIYLYFIYFWTHSMGQFCFKLDFNVRLLKTTKQRLQGLNVSWFHCERSGFVLRQLLWI